MIKWGIIGLGNIAKRFAKSLSCSNEGKLFAIASKTKEDIFCRLQEEKNND